MRGGRLGRAVALVLALAGPLGGVAHAKTSASLPFAPADLWATAVRLLRVDLGYAIKEKDADAGYVLFEMTEGQKRYKGSLELIPHKNAEGRAETQAQISLPDLPRHYEVLLVDKLTAKVKEELGTPPAAPRKRPEPAKRPDAGS